MKFWKSAQLLIAMLVALAAFAGPARAYEVSGTVSYGGAKSGRVYLYLEGSNGVGTSVATAGSTYAIRGVPNGNYTLHAFMDTIGNGMRHAADPAGTLESVTVSGGDALSRNITLLDPSAVTPAAPEGVVAFPANGTAFIMWETAENQDGILSAEYYLVEYSTNPSFSGSTKKTVPANDDNFMILGGLVNGSTYYVRVAAKVGAATSTATEADSPVTIGAPAGGYTVSVPLTLTGFTNPGPLYLVVMNDTGNMYFTKVTSPATGTFAVTGVQNGTYQIHMFVDMNDNGVLDTGDISPDREDVLVTVSGGSVTAQSMSLNAANTFAEVRTSHYKSGASTVYSFEGYTLNFEVEGGLKQPVKVTLTGGPAGTTYPVDIALSRDGGDFNLWLSASTRPTVGDTYTFTVGYSDDTIDANVNAQVTGVLDTFPTPLAPIGTIGGPTSTVPSFAWLPPASPPAADYSYSLWLSSENHNNLWFVEGMPATQTRVGYNFDDEASTQQLSVGSTYNWGIAVEDSFGNRADTQSSFSVVSGSISFAGRVLDSANSPLPGVTVALEGTEGIWTTTAADGTFSLTGLPYGMPFVLKFTRNGYLPAYSQYLVSTVNITNSSPIKLFTSAEAASLGVDSSHGAIAGVVTNDSGYVGGAVVTATGMSGNSYAVTYFDGSGFGGTSTNATNGLAFVQSVNGGDTVMLHASKSGWSFGDVLVPINAGSVSEAVLYGSPLQNSLSVTISGNGSVHTTDPVGYSCSEGTCTAPFNTGSTVILTATAASDSLFSGWSGDCTNSSGSCTVTMNGDKAITATFETLPPVYVQGGGYFNTLQLALDSATNSSFTVMAQDTVLTGDLTARYGNTVSFKGGYDSSFGQKINGGYTTMAGILILSTGSLTVEDLVIR